MHFSIIFDIFPIKFALFSDIEEGERKIFVSSPQAYEQIKRVG